MANIKDRKESISPANEQANKVSIEKSTTETIKKEAQ